jgi:peptidoglycan/xylan/chitin deacetylase (PgdA/CDA1 family)
MHVVSRVVMMASHIERRVFFVFVFFVATATSGVGSSKSRSVAVTFDDLPAVASVAENCNLEGMLDLNGRLLEQIEAHKVPATGLVKEGGICERLREEQLPRLLSIWLDAGHELGNHTFSHFDINSTPLDVYQEDVIKGERALRRVLGKRGRTLRYFRHPLLHAGDDATTKQALDAFLKERGYTIAAVTIDNQEWMYADVYVRAKRRGDRKTMQKVVDAYVPFMESVFDFFEKWSVEVLGYEPPQVLLLHANELNADHFGALAEMMKRRGYAFITLEKALADKAYRRPDDYVGPRGLSWIHRWAVTQGMELKEEPREPDWLAELYRSYQY